MAFIRIVSAGMYTGKTNFIKSIKNIPFNPATFHTTTNDNLYLVPFNGNYYNVMEIPGGEHQHSLSFNDGDVVIVFTPVDKRVEFKMTKQYIKRIQNENKGKNIPIIVCLSKTDVSNRRITPDMVADVEGIVSYHEISNRIRDDRITNLFADAVSRLKQ